MTIGGGRRRMRRMRVWVLGLWRRKGRIGGAVGGGRVLLLWWWW
jgi:hypothetical protein